MSTHGSERRKDVRADARLEVRLSGPDDGRGVVEDGAYSVTSVNLGAGGVYIEVPNFIEPLTKVSLAMIVPGPTAEERPAVVETEAIVVRTLPESPREDVDRYEVACSFLDLSDEQRDVIHRYILTHRGAGAAPTRA